MGDYRTSPKLKTLVLKQRNAQEQFKKSKARQKRHCILVIYAVAFCVLSFTDFYTTAEEIHVKSSQKLKLDETTKINILNLNETTKINISNLNVDFKHDRNFVSLDVNCTHSGADDFPEDLFTAYQRRHGAIVIHFLASVYIFYALLLVCDDYFVPSVECICREFRIPSDVAGATFMAVSTSAPELFTNIIGTFVTKGDIGVGTIVGSAVFNILAVGACCGIGAGMAVHKMKGPDGRIGVPLEWWPLTRDCVFYLLSVAALIMVLSNRRVYWPEALAMLFLYGLYIVAMCYNATLKSWAESFVSRMKSGENKKSSRKISFTVQKVLSVATESTPLLLGLKQDKKVEICHTKIDRESGESSSSGSTKEYEVSGDALDEVLITNAVIRSNSFSKSAQEEWILFTLPIGEDWTVWLEWIIGWPIRLVFTFTVPDCRKYAFRKWYPITLLMCVVWIGSLSYVVSWMMTIIGKTLHIPDSVTGLTFLAAGTSIPEVISSIIVARQGLGSMGLSNSIGSNTFDVLVCLGLPWLIQSALLTSQDADYIKINSAGMEYSALLLITSLFVLYTIIAWNGFLLDRMVGVLSLLMYIVFVTVACLLEMNVFFPVNLPPCE